MKRRGPKNLLFKGHRNSLPSAQNDRIEQGMRFRTECKTVYGVVLLAWVILQSLSSLAATGITEVTGTVPFISG